MTNTTDLLIDELKSLRKDVRTGFDGVERRFDKLERNYGGRIGRLETGVKVLKWIIPIVMGIVMARCISPATVDAPFHAIGQALEGDNCPTPVPIICAPMTVTPAPTSTSGIPQPTATPEPEQPTVTPSPTPAPNTSPTPTPEGVPEGPITGTNLLRNQGMEEPYRPVLFPEVNVAYGWEPFYCDQPYLDHQCLAYRQGADYPPGMGGNPVGLLMGRPEYKVTYLSNRVVAGAAQQWFCFWRTCEAGVYQTVDVPVGVWCEAGAQVQSWSSNGVGFTSDLYTADQRDNSTWFIKIDPTGGTNAFASGLLVSRGFGFGDGIYDQYVTISYRFQTTSPRITVFYDNLRLWPIANNDNYLDRAYVRCQQP